MLAAAQSPPPPPQQRFSPAHRHLALLRTADWRQSVATPLPHANGEAENKEPRGRGCVHAIFSIFKNRFLQSRPTLKEGLKDFGGKCERRVENQTGALRTAASSLSISASSLLLLCLCAFTRLPALPSRLSPVTDHLLRAVSCPSSFVGV